MKIPLPVVISLIVTQELIDSGKKNSCSKCPLALAGLKLPTVERVHVDGEQFEIQFTQGIGIYRMTDKSYDFIHDFDYDGPSAVKPATFKLGLSHYYTNDGQNHDYFPRKKRVKQ